MACDHHGVPHQPQPDFAKLMRRFDEQVQGTAKREYSQGRIGADDEGDLAIAFAADKAHGVVVIRFGKPTEWIGLPPQQAVEFAQKIIAMAKEVSREPLVFSL